MKRIMSALVIVGALVFPAMASAATTVWNDIPATNPGNLPSVGVEAYSFNQIGNQIRLHGTQRHLTSVKVMFSSWACESGSWTGTPSACITDPGATFQAPVTLTLYRAAVAGPNPGEFVPGQPFFSVTRTFTFPFRPTASNKCANMGKPGEWYDSTLEQCFNGEATSITFGRLAGKEIKLPHRLVWGVSYNSDTSGPNPLGGTNSPTDSLNVGLAPKTLVGSQVTPGSIFWDTRYQGFSCAAPPPAGNNGPFVTGVFNQDGPCNGATNDWTGYIPAITIKAQTAF